MNETLKQLKKSEDNTGSVLQTGKNASTKVSSSTKKNQVGGSQASGHLDGEDLELLADEEDKAIIEQRAGRGKGNLIYDDEKRARSVGGMIEDDEDLPSDQEREIMDETNNDIDGHIKIAKDVRGYDDAHEDN